MKKLAKEHKEWFKKFIAEIGRGGYPAICGRGLTDIEIVDISIALFKRGPMLSASEVVTGIDYYNTSILNRRWPDATTNRYVQGM